MHRNPDSDSVGFLLADVSRLLRRDFDRRVRALELTQAQWRAIARLARQDGVNQTALAEQLEVAPITLGRLVDRLETAGWVRREADPADRRASLLYLTPKAEPIIGEIRALADEALADLMAGIAESARTALVETLVRMKQNLTEAEAAAGHSSTEGTTDDGRKRQDSKHRSTR
jgi:MarR family transcriptional regulator, transcriptional regulator for hemolysin